MKTTVFHLPNPCIRVRLAVPLFVADLLLVLAGLIEASQFVVGWIAIARLFFVELSQVSTPVIAVVFADNALERCIGFEVGCVNADRLASQEAVVAGGLQDEFECKLMDLHRQAFAGEREGAVVRGGFNRAVTKESSQRTAVVAPPRDATLR